MSATTPSPSRTGHERIESVICRVLRVQEGCPAASEEQANRMFSTSIALSALRCTMTYLVLPVVAPLIGTSGLVDSSVGLPLGAVALVFDVIAIRRFWLSRHRWRWRMTAVYGVVIAMVVGLIVADSLRLAGA